MTRIRTTALAVAAALWTAGVLGAQVQTGGSQAPPPIDAAMTKRVIDAALKELDQNYVFPDVAKKMGLAIRGRLASGDYADVKTGPELAKLLTEHLQEISHDKHLRVNYNAQPPAPMTKAVPEAKAQLTAEQKAQLKAQQKTRIQKMNAAFRRVERLAGNVGYLELDNFMDAQMMTGPAEAAMKFLANVDALIFDLRRNGGGSPTGVAHLSSYLFDSEKPVHLNSLYFRPSDQTEDFYTRKDVPGPRFADKDVYILTSSRTFSAAEEFTYNLQCLKRATIVGETTGGGAHPGGQAPLGDRFVMFVPRGRAINPITKTNWEGVGVKPDIAVPADQALEAAHKHATDKLLEKAPDEETRRMIRMELERDRERRKSDPAK